MTVSEHIILHATSPLHACKSYYDKLTMLEQWVAGWQMLRVDPTHILAIGAAKLVPTIFKQLFGIDVKYDNNWSELNEILSTATVEDFANISSDLSFVSMVLGGSEPGSCNCTELTKNEVQNMFK